MPHLTGSLARMGYGGVAVGSDLSYYQQMIDSITDYEVIRLDENGRVRWWSPGARRLKQYTEEEVLGRHVSMFYTEDDKRAGLADREMATAAQNGRFETEGWRVRKDGSRFWAHIVVRPIPDQSGELVRLRK